MNRNALKDSTNAPPSQDGALPGQPAAVNKPAAVLAPIKVKRKTNTETVEVESSNNQTRIKFLVSEVTFAPNETVAFKIYATTLLVVGTAIVFWVTKGWALLAIAYKKMAALKIKSLLGK